jgi:nucleoid-associated protein EbfC
MSCHDYRYGPFEEDIAMAKGFNPMQQVKELQDKMTRMQEDLATMTVESSAGGGMVTVVVNGRQEVVSIKIDRQVVDPEDMEMLQDLVPSTTDLGKLKSSQPGKWRRLPEA